MNNFYLIKNSVMKQIRTYPFLITIGITLFCGYAFVPAATAGYEVFYIGGVRGIYNSAWLGGVAAMVSTIFLWLFGFYLLRSQISDDERLKVGQIIAASSISNVRYIFSKAFANFCILSIIASILMVAFMAMQLLRGEDDTIQLWQYVGPFIFVTLPALFVLSSFTIFFDVFRWLKGVIGNIIFFALWIFFAVISIEKPTSLFNALGFDVIMSNAEKDAATEFAMSNFGASFGYYPVDGPVQTFIWQGVDWDFSLLTLRLIWLLISITILIISAMVFNRFKHSKGHTKKKNIDIFQPYKKEEISLKEQKEEYNLTPLIKKSRIRFIPLIKAELLIMVKGFSIWMYLLCASIILLSAFLPLTVMKSWVSFIIILPIAIWSRMGTKEKHFFTKDLIISSGPSFPRVVSLWIAGLSVGCIVSLGVLIRFMIEGQMSQFLSWVIGIMFIPTLALALGSVSGTKKLFEIIFLLWWYLGPMNGIPYLDFLGMMNNHEVFYLISTVILLIFIMLYSRVQANEINFK
ncbi:hypothetical protein ACFSKI_14585 [Pseudogracilibacillus auburnensis]|uniref:ABC-2 type transport system permease protein n=1 Tax=Pseudogracilibacillus auburnensis TaxID=1494959 RepID=A0A2V3VV05_9BACI|nr:hypothetical protein [Pseudogracilibacillus auburnensis]PXW83845.1 hypothetical protein DFR56_114130 [Pseudogracilibacillus auburnensis]